jgi:hypothetical protein
VTGVRVVVVSLTLSLSLAACGIFPSSHVVDPVILRLRQTATQSVASGPIRSAAVFVFIYPVTTANTKALGDTYALADVQECAGPQGLRQEPVRPFTGSGWEINFTPGTGGGGEVAGPSSVALRQPSFNEFMGLKPNQCASGWLTFEVDGMRPVFVTLDSPYAEWRVSPKVTDFASDLTHAQSLSDANTARVASGLVTRIRCNPSDADEDTGSA